MGFRFYFRYIILLPQRFVSHNCSNIIISWQASSWVKLLVSNGKKTVAKHVDGSYHTLINKHIYVYRVRFRPVLQKYSYYYSGYLVVRSRSTTQLRSTAIGQPRLRYYSHVNRPNRRHVATRIAERRGHDFVVRSHLVVIVLVVGCRLYRVLGHQHVHQRILQHQHQQPHDPGELWVPAGPRRQLRRTAHLHHPPAEVSPGHHYEPVHDTAQQQFVHRPRDNNRYMMAVTWVYVKMG